MNDLVSISGICFVTAEKKKYRPRGSRTRKEQQAAAARSYYRRHRLEILASRKARREQCLKNGRAYRAAHAEEVRQYQRSYYAAHRDKICEQRRTAYHRRKVEQE